MADTKSGTPRRSGKRFVRLMVLPRLKDYRRLPPRTFPYTEIATLTGATVWLMVLSPLSSCLKPVSEERPRGDSLTRGVPHGSVTTARLMVLPPLSSCPEIYRRSASEEISLYGVPARSVTPRG
ncbi:hypothetical protein NDU88_005349 [Pleurodeles waltl]|uniref:Uncharacterized protein n=1 Tax=Pleurodeles waltl TaxID=8319 RepID=A0AAV7MCN4_PLEWA|nr:hypothetical protein NDU88_005349 [Pleurodeles waltl]